MVLIPLSFVERYKSLGIYMGLPYRGPYVYIGHTSSIEKLKKSTSNYLCRIIQHFDFPRMRIN